VRPQPAAVRHEQLPRTQPAAPLADSEQEQLSAGVVEARTLTSSSVTSAAAALDLRTS
jgi:hypothetical protein